jgi:hypothetical protein
VAEPLSARERASRAARNASSGIRRRLGDFLRSDAIELIREGGLAWAIAAVGFAAGVLLFLSEFMAVRYVQTNTASCDELARADLRDSCLVIGHESHAWSIALLGVFVIVMTYGVVAGASRPAAVALLVAGVVGLGITLIHDLPQTGRTGGVGADYALAKAHRGTGFWLEGIGSILAIACGSLAVWRMPPPLRARNRDRPAPAPPGDAEEPAIT